MKLRIQLANLVITAVRLFLVPSGHNYRYALRLPVLDKVNFMSLRDAPLFDGERRVR